MKIKIVVADDHKNVRKELRKLLNRSPQVEIVGEAAGGLEAINLTRQFNPDVLLLDVEMPDMNGYEVARRLADEGSSTRILAVSGYDEKRTIFGMFSSGAVGYLTKDEAPEKLLTAIEDIASGRKGWISPKIAKKLGVPDQSNGQNTFPAMTEGEITILNYLANEKSIHEIATAMQMANQEIQDHIRLIIDKLGVKSRQEAILRAMQENIIK